MAWQDQRRCPLSSQGAVKHVGGTIIPHDSSPSALPPLLDKLLVLALRQSFLNAVLSLLIQTPPQTFTCTPEVVSAVALRLVPGQVPGSTQRWEHSSAWGAVWHCRAGAGAPGTAGLGLGLLALLGWNLQAAGEHFWRAVGAAASQVCVCQSFSGHSEWPRAQGWPQQRAQAGWQEGDKRGRVAAAGWVLLESSLGLLLCQQFSSATPLREAIMSLVPAGVSSFCWQQALCQPHQVRAHPRPCQCPAAGGLLLPSSWPF